MSIVRSSPHPESARHLLQVRAGPQGSRVVLVEFERPRSGGDVLSEVESCPLPPPEARALHVKARLVPIQDVPALLHATRPKPPPKPSPPGGTKRIPPVTLTAHGIDALDFLVQWLHEHQQERRLRSIAVDVAVQEAARARGWTPPGTEPASAPEEQEK
jgi:hypothetical protein